MFQLSDVERALALTSSAVPQGDKVESLRLLETFQKSVEAWNMCHQILSQDFHNSNPELYIFAAQTLRNKVTYDLAQIQGNVIQFKDSLLKLLTNQKQKLIITQLNVALARLAIQFLEWKNPMIEIIQHLNPYPDILLSFLKILPEETLDLGSTPLTKEEFDSRTHELVTSIGEDVLNFLISTIDLIKSNNSSGLTFDQVLSCLASWAFEFPIDKLLSVHSLISLVFESLNNGNNDDPITFDAAVDCLIVILRESRDASNEQIVLSLYEQLIALQQRLLPTLLSTNTDKVTDEEEDALEGLTRVFVEAAEAWCLFIAKNPQVYLPLVNILLMLTCKNQDLEVVAYTFPFWFNLKQSLVLPRYKASKEAYTPVYINLINGIINCLNYPIEGFSNHEEEDKFKDFRYTMGDVLKDCTAVVGTTNSLTQPLERITKALQENSPWQVLEAPLFSLRTMAEEISLTEHVILPQIFNIIINLPKHPKIRYASTLVLGRYTEWTAKHPETLESQLSYIFQGFEEFSNDNDVITASSHALMYFCSDCSDLLTNYLDQLYNFYFKVQNIIDIESQFELCQGLSAVLNKQPIDRVAEMFQQLIDNNLSQLAILVNNWKNDNTTYSLQVADKIDLLFAMFEELKPRYEYPQMGAEPILPQIEFLWTSLRSLLVDMNAASDHNILERTTKLLRRIFEKYHIFCELILPSVAEFLATGYANTGLGSYLWCSGSIITVFGDDESLPIPPQVREAVWHFAVSQCNTFFINIKKLEATSINENYEMIMDFFAMCSDLLMFYPKEFINMDKLLGGVFDVGLSSVTHLENFDSYIYIIRFLDDILSWGFKTPPISTATIDIVPDSWRQQIFQHIIILRGKTLVTTLFHGLVTNFHANAQADTVSCIVKAFRLATEMNNNDPSACTEWLTAVAMALNDVTQKEMENLNDAVMKGLQQRDFRKIREGIKSFINWYFRRHITRDINEVK